MTLGALMAQLAEESDAAHALAALGDLPLFAAVAAAGDRFAETPGEYVANASRRFAAAAQDEDWLALMTAMERASDPGRAALDRMLRWSLARDEAGGDDEEATSECTCGGGGGGCHGQAHP